MSGTMVTGIEVVAVDMLEGEGQGERLAGTFRSYKLA